MSRKHVCLSAVAVGCLSIAAWGCDDATDAARISGVSRSTHSLAAAPFGVPVYDVTPISATSGVRVSQSGDVVGWTTANGPTEPMLYTPETGVVVLPTSISQPYGIARDLSERSAGVITVVGEAKLNTSGSSIHAVRWHVAVPQGTVLDVTDLGVLPGHFESFANAVNSAGQIAGTSDPDSYLSIRSFIYSDATGMVDLGLGAIGTNARALDLNASGVVTGYLGLQAFRWSVAGGLESLGSPAGLPNSFGNAINASGQVAGSAGTSDGNTERVVRYTDGTGWKILGGSGESNVGKGINQWGDVVGTVGPHVSFLRGVIYTDNLGFLAFIDDLLLVPGSWKIMEAYDINDAQQITGWAINNQTGLASAVLLTPVIPAPPNEPPVASFTYSCNVFLFCGFDGSSSTDDRGVLDWLWTLNGETIGTAEFFGYQFGAPQTVDVTLTVTDSRGAKSTITLPVVVGGANQPPVARYTVSCSPGACVLDASSSTDDKGIVSYGWKASVSSRADMTGVQITRSWLPSGDNTYQETLTVTDGDGLTNSVTQTIVIPPPPANQPPVANFTVTCSPGKCVLDASSSTDDHGIVSYSWRASDKNRLPKTGAVITREWLAGGANTYQETLTVTDGDRLRSSLKKKITIPKP
jgi:probable HAF family extracellular repeat protein